MEPLPQRSGIRPPFRFLALLLAVLFAVAGVLAVTDAAAEDLVRAAAAALMFGIGTYFWLRVAAYPRGWPDTERVEMGRTIPGRRLLFWVAIGGCLILVSAYIPEGFEDEFILAMLAACVLIGSVSRVRRTRRAAEGNEADR